MLRQSYRIEFCHPSILLFQLSTMAAENRAPQVTGVAALFLVLSTLTILARSYCRIFVVKGFGLDDWAAVIAWVRPNIWINKYS